MSHRAEVGSVRWAASLAWQHLAVLGDRWRHTKAVAARGSEIAITVPPQDRKLLVAAAWLHDLGYGPGLCDTGFHPLDGARFLLRAGADARLCALVAHHSGAMYEAEQRCLSTELGEFIREDGAVLDALVYADLTTGPQGQSFTFEERIEEILDRYPPDDPVHRAVSAASPYLAGCVDRTLERLAVVAG